MTNEQYCKPLIVETDGINWDTLDYKERIYALEAYREMLEFDPLVAVAVESEIYWHKWILEQIEEMAGDPPQIVGVLIER